MKGPARAVWPEPGKTLSQRVGRGALWLSLLGASSGALRIIRTIVLARLLTPHDFGLMGIALIAISALNSFSQIGFRVALVQKEGDISTYLDTAWIIRIGRGLLLAFLLFFSAPILASFFEAPDSRPVLQVIALAFFLEGWTNIALVYFQKELDFGKQVVYQFSMVASDFLAALILAFFLRNVWALVLGFVISNVVGLVVSYWVCPYRPRFDFNLAKARELNRFGKWVFFSNLFDFLNRQGEHAIVGKWLGTTSLGWYQVAYRMANLPAIQMTELLKQLMFPAYAKLQGNSPKLREAYLQTLQLTAFLVVPFTCGTIVLASGLTQVFLGERWMPIVPAMQILMVFGLSQALVGTAVPLFLAVGRPDIVTKLRALRLIVLFLLIFPFAFRWGVEGAALAAVISSLSELPFHCFLAIRTVKCRMGEFLKMILFPLAGSGVMVSAVFGIQQTPLLPQTVGGLLVLIGIPGILYLLVALGFEKWLNYGLLSHLKERFQSL